MALSLLPLILGHQALLSEADRLTIYRLAFSYQASRITGPVDGFSLQAMDEERRWVPATKLRPLARGFAAPVETQNKPHTKKSVSLYVLIEDVIDARRVLVKTSYFREESVEERFVVLVRRGTSWRLTEPKLKVRDEAAISQAGLLRLLADRENGYRSILSSNLPKYVGLLTTGNRGIPVGVASRHRSSP